MDIPARARVRSLRTSPRRAVIYAIAALVSIYVICFIAVLRPAVRISVNGRRHRGARRPVQRNPRPYCEPLITQSLSIVPAWPQLWSPEASVRRPRQQAAVGQSYLILNRVRETDIVVRPEGRSTGASMASVAQWLGAIAPPRPPGERPFHSLRLRLEAHRVSIDGYTSPTTTSPISRQFSSELPISSPSPPRSR